MRNRDRSLALALFVATLSAYFFTANPHIAADGTHMFQLTRAIAERGSLTLPDGFGVEGAGDRQVCKYGIATSLAALPLFYLGRASGALLGFSTSLSSEAVASLMNQLLTALCVLWVFWLSMALGYGRRASVAVALVYGFVYIRTH